MPRRPPKSVTVNGRYGRLVVVRKHGQDKHGRTMWLCLCDCGSITITASALLNSGTKSCGCLQREAAKAGGTHGMSQSAEYRAWVHMRERCLNPNTKHYERYGARGITVCAQWLDFESFLRDMGTKPVSAWLERRNNNGNYEPNNCYWATPKQQSRNKSTNIRIVHEGRVQVVADWAKEKGLAASTICRRLFHLGWTVKQTLETAPYQRCT